MRILIGSEMVAGGDNMLAALPDIIAQTVAAGIGGAMAGRDTPAPDKVSAPPDPLAEQREGVALSYLLPPERPAPMRIIGRGDSYWNLAADDLAGASDENIALRMAQYVEANPGVDPRALQSGQRINVPGYDIEVSAEAWAELAQSDAAYRQHLAELNDPWAGLRERYGGGGSYVGGNVEYADLTFFSGGTSEGRGLVSDLRAVSGARTGLAALRLAGLGELAPPIALVLGADMVIGYAAVIDHGAPLMVPRNSLMYRMQRGERAAPLPALADPFNNGEPLPVGIAQDEEYRRLCENIGRWARDNSSMSDASFRYQGQITGAPGFHFNVEGVWFDGCLNTPIGPLLLEAKSNMPGPFGEDWWEGNAGIVQQGREQQRVATSLGVRAEWHFASASDLTTTQRLWSNALPPVYLQAYHTPAR